MSIVSRYRPNRTLTAKGFDWADLVKAAGKDPSPPPMTTSLTAPSAKRKVAAAPPAPPAPPALPAGPEKLKAPAAVPEEIPAPREGTGTTKTAPPKLGAGPAKPDAPLPVSPRRSDLFYDPNEPAVGTPSGAGLNAGGAGAGGGGGGDPGEQPWIQGVPNWMVGAGLGAGGLAGLYGLYRMMYGRRKKEAADARYVQSLARRVGS